MAKGSVFGGFFVFAGACSFGILSTIVKLAYANGLTPGQVTGAQAFGGMCILWVLYAVFASRGSKPHTWASGGKSNPFKVLAAGTFTGMVGIFYYQCVRLVPASVAIILLMQYLWMSLVIEKVIFKKNPRREELFAAALVLVGTVLAGGAFSSSLAITGKGVVFGLLSALAYALFLLVSGRVGNDLPPLKKSALMITGSCMLICTVYPPLFLLDLATLRAVLPWGAALAVFGTVIPPFFFSVGIPRLGVGLSALLSSAELPVAVFTSWAVLHESVDWIRWLGVAIIFSAIMLPHLPIRKTGQKTGGKTA